MQHLITAEPAYLAQYLSPRAGEQRIGQQLQLLPRGDTNDALVKLRDNGVQFVLLGVPEDIGPRANLGRGGADRGWDAFLTSFLNLQHNQYIDTSKIALLGHVLCDDLQKLSQNLTSDNLDELAQIRQHVATLDQRVEAICHTIAQHRLIPIVIGGGHNNALPIISGISRATQDSLAAVNLDPHTDFRALEGRHSGNGFSYAAKAGSLSHYFSLGLHQLKNSQANLDYLAQFKFPHISYQQIIVERSISFEEAIVQAVEYLESSNKPVGIELDLDSISFMPASAYTNAGFTLADALYYVHRIANIEQCCYLHLAEGAPCHHPGGLEAGMSDIGNALANLVCSFIQART